MNQTLQDFKRVTPTYNPLDEMMLSNSPELQKAYFAKIDEFFSSIVTTKEQRMAIDEMHSDIDFANISPQIFMDITKALKDKGMSAADIQDSIALKLRKLSNIEGTNADELANAFIRRYNFIHQMTAVARMSPGIAPQDLFSKIIDRIDVPYLYGKVNSVTSLDEIKKMFPDVPFDSRPPKDILEAGLSGIKVRYESFVE